MAASKVFVLMVEYSKEGGAPWFLSRTFDADAYAVKATEIVS